MVIFDKLTEKATHATVAAIQAYNNPTSVYRAETFSILSINGWELLIKAKWLKEHDDDMASLHVTRNVTDEGSGEKRKIIMKSLSGIPRTEGFISLAGRLRGMGMLNENVYLNLQALVEIRNAAIHFHDESGRLEARVHEIASASVMNFVSVMNEWFQRDLSEEYRFSPMPLAFVNIARSEETVISGEVANLLNFLDSLESESDISDAEHSIAIRLDLNLTRSPRSSTTPEVRMTNNPDAREVQLVEEDFRKLYPWTYGVLTEKCKGRYSDFKQNNEYHKLRKEIAKDSRFAHIRSLDPENSRSGAKTYFSPNILQEFDKRYTRK